MGKFEKFVVLAVLFLVTLILVVSLNTNEPETLAQASLGGVEEVMPDPVMEPTSDPVSLWMAEDDDEDVDEVKAAVVVDDEEAFDPVTALLSGQVDEEVVIESGFLHPEDLIDLPEGTILREPVGLNETFDSTVFSINVSAGDTYQSIALKYYGDARYAAMLQQANDDPMTEPVSETIMLPAFDMRVQREDRVSGKTHQVETGDTFGGIAQQYYRDAGQWKKIMDANLDKVSSETGLRPGMILVIP